MLLLQDCEIHSIVGGSPGVVTPAQISAGGYEGLGLKQDLSLTPANIHALGSDGDGIFSLLPSTTAFDSYEKAMNKAFG